MSTSKGGAGPEAWGVFANLWQLIEGLMDESEADLEALGLSVKAFFLLASVEKFPFPAELARTMHMPPPTVTYMVKQLESKGFLERRSEPGDLRRFRLVQTEAGRGALDRGCRFLGEVLARRLARLDRKDFAAFDRIVKQLAAADDEDVK